MKPRAEGGVVDSHLNVYGVQNLKLAGMSCSHTPGLSDELYPPIRIVDLSICPGNVAAVSANHDYCQADRSDVPSLSALRTHILRL